jgi:hypothetical protein
MILQAADLALLDNPKFSLYESIFKKQKHFLSCILGLKKL